MQQNRGASSTQSSHQPPQQLQPVVMRVAAQRPPVYQSATTFNSPRTLNRSQCKALKEQMLQKMQ